MGQTAYAQSDTKHRGIGAARRSDNRLPDMIFRDQPNDAALRASLPSNRELLILGFVITRQRHRIVASES